MKYARLHAGKNGKSHFDDVMLKLDEADYRPPAPLLYVSHIFPTDGMQLIRLPAGWAGEHVHPPKKQFLICLQGHLEVTASDGEKRSFGPGDSVMMEDVAGDGHATRVKGEECVAAVIPVD